MQTAPMIESSEHLVESCARAAHEANRAYCIAIGDTSQKSWDEADQWQRDSAVRGIKTALAGATPEQQHGAWMADKLRDGWKYGPVKDAGKKEHPCMVSYSDLPEDQRRKDAIYIAVVKSMAGALGIDYLAEMRNKVEQCIAEYRTLSPEEMPRVLSYMPYKVGETWMYNEPDEVASKGMGYQCFTAKLIT